MTPFRNSLAAVGLLAATVAGAHAAPQLEPATQRFLDGLVAAEVALLSRERHGPAIRAQLLFYPVTDANFEDGSWLTKAAMKWFWDAYLPDAARRTDPHVSPLHASDEQLARQPPALVITDENDVLRDEGEAYARRLSQAGVKVTSTRYNGTIHDFVMLNALAGTPAARAAAQGNAFLRQALYGG